MSQALALPFLKSAWVFCNIFMYFRNEDHAARPCAHARELANLVACIVAVGDVRGRSLVQCHMVVKQEAIALTGAGMLATLWWFVKVTVRNVHDLYGMRFRCGEAR